MEGHRSVAINYYGDTVRMPISSRCSITPNTSKPALLSAVRLAPSPPPVSSNPTCQPTSLSRVTMAEAIPKDTPSFYLHDEGALNHSAVLACLEARVRLPLPRWDDGLGADVVMSISDAHLLRQLAAHPARVHRPQLARLHFLAILPTTSLHASRRGCGSHNERMQSALQALRARVDEASAGTLFVFVQAYFECQNALTVPLLDYLLQTNANTTIPRIIVVNHDAVHGGMRPTGQWYCDPRHNRFRPSPYNITAFTPVRVPYPSMYRLDEAARRPGGCTDGQRNVSFMFAGTLDRNGEGALRGPTVRAFTQGRQDARVVSHNTAHDRSAAMHMRVADETAAVMQRARFCLVPAGDTATTRRMFDALAAGCMPVYLGDFDLIADSLPFMHSLDWNTLVVYAGRMKCLVQDNASAAAALAEQLMAREPNAAAFDVRACEERRTAYLRSLSHYGAGVADTLLHELSTLLPTRRCTTLGDAREKSGHTL